MAGRERDKQRENQWRDVFARFLRSGLSVRAFCRHERVSEPSFYAWRKIIRQRDGSQPGVAQESLAPGHPAPAFLPVVVQAGVGPVSGIYLELCGGRRLHWPDSLPVERLAALVQALERTENQR